MKELSIEEKAKRYDEIINRMEYYVVDEYGCSRIKVADVFPELKESEDERIRKELIQFIKNWKAPNNIGRPHDFPTFTRNVEQCDRYIAWLENQDEQISANSCKTCKDEQKPIERKGFTTIPFGAIDSELIEETITIPNGCYATIEGNKIHIKKKDKSATEAIKEETVDNANKVEPTFKAGDWVVRTNGESFCNGSKFAQIQSIELDGEMCYLDTGRWLYPSEIRLWTINEAQEGDVLCYKDEISLYKHDIKNCAKEETTFGGFVYHCCYDGKRFITDSLYSLTEQDKMDIYPATTEQRNILFQKMKEAGYEWDSEKKEPIRRI